MAKVRKHHEQSVIALDQNFIPMLKVSRHHAIKSVVSGRAQILDLTTWERTDDIGNYKTIKVIVYPHTRVASEMKVKAGSVGRGILRRDHHTCQYDECTVKATTIDHVLPRAQGGQTVWSNLVACCLGCNQKKGNRTPEQAGMKLKGPIRHVRYLLYEEFSRAVESAKAV